MSDKIQQDASEDDAACCNKAVETEDANEIATPPGFWAVIVSTCAAAFGVQSAKNYKRDFRHGNIWIYMIAGVVFTALFVLVVALIVANVLENT